MGFQNVYWGSIVFITKQSGQWRKLNIDIAPRPTTGVTITCTSTDPPHAGQKQAQQPP